MVLTFKDGSDIGATIADNFNVEAPEWGTSLMEYLK